MGRGSGQTPVTPWGDFFFQLEDTASGAATAADTLKATQRAYGRYAKGIRAIVQSIDAPVGQTPKELIWSLNKTCLYRYRPVLPVGERHSVPLLLVYALINKPFIFDLGPGRSFVEYLIGQGFDVYLLDWGKPGPEDQKTTFDDYISQYLYRAVRKVHRLSPVTEVSLLGYCLGATLATVYTAHYSQVPVRNLILLTAPIDFSEEPTGSMTAWLQEGRLDVDKLVEAYGNVPGELIRHWAKMLKPMENFVGAYVNLWKNLDDEEAVRSWQAVNRWVEDVIPVAGEAFRQFVCEYVRENQLARGEHVIQARRVDLSRIRASLLNVVAQFDHLVARSQAESLMDLVSSQDKELRVIPTTHVGMMASHRAKYKLWPDLARWLAERSD